MARPKQKHTMKKMIVLVAAFLTISAAAQTPTNNMPVPQKDDQVKQTPENRAKKDAIRAQKTLNLDAEQTVKWETATLERMKVNEPLKKQMKATTDKVEKRKIATQMKPNLKKFDDTVNGFLTADQKTKWEQVKKDKKEKHKGQKGHQGDPDNTDIQQ